MALVLGMKESGGILLFSQLPCSPGGTLSELAEGILGVVLETPRLLIRGGGFNIHAEEAAVGLAQVF